MNPFNERKWKWFRQIRIPVRQNGSGGSRNENNPRRTSLILLAIAAIVTLISMSLFMRMINNATNQEITYGKFQELVEDGRGGRGYLG